MNVTSRCATQPKFRARADAADRDGARAALREATAIASDLDTPTPLITALVLHAEMTLEDGAPDEAAEAGTRARGMFAALRDRAAGLFRR